MFGLGKRRTKLGKWIDRKGITQEWIIKNCKVNKNTASNLCGDVEYKPNGSTKGRIIMGLREHGHDVYIEDFWEDE